MNSTPEGFVGDDFFCFRVCLAFAGIYLDFTIFFPFLTRQNVEMGGATSKTYIFKPLDYSEMKKDCGISLEQYLYKELAVQYQIPKTTDTARPIHQMTTLIRAIHQNQEHVYPIQFELLFVKEEIIVRLKRYPAGS